MQFLFLLLLRLFILLPQTNAKYHSGSGNSQERQHQKFAMEPQDQTAIVGSRVTLPCRVVDKTGQIQWTKDDFGLGVHRNLSGYERYSMVGSDEEGDFSLDIFPAMLDDDARYQCQVSAGANGEHFCFNLCVFCFVMEQWELVRNGMTVNNLVTFFKDFLFSSIEMSRNLKYHSYRCSHKTSVGRGAFFQLVSGRFENQVCEKMSESAVNDAWNF